MRLYQELFEKQEERKLTPEEQDRHDRVMGFNRTMGMVLATRTEFNNANDDPMRQQLLNEWEALARKFADTYDISTLETELDDRRAKVSS